MTTETDLLPCPFCGSADAPRLKNTHTASFWVSCSEEDGGCGAKASGQFFPGPSRRTRFCYEPEEPEGSKFYARTLGELHPEYRRAAKSAIAAWNRRACVSSATAPLQAEIEALRAEVERSERYAEQSERERLWAEERAERLAEALRELVEVFSESGMYDEEVFDKARAALGKESKR